MEPTISSDLKLYIIDKIVANYYESTITERNAEYARGIIDCIDAVLAMKSESA